MDNHVTQHDVDTSVADALQTEVRFEKHSESSPVAVEQGSPVLQQDQLVDPSTDWLSQVLLAQQLPKILVHRNFIAEEKNRRRLEGTV